eukprot:CAMPEP_0194033460 /NCGR_PEP_ID=MMETSP0009_2-20130614/6151_1 /TAXON_ID=210454 /ORGANISM="Grammatophora oceanica, Strain CCMP 410" /LENGTH=430 /DNA_ID=CAMNT_0038674159 /DNA_START=73 /DNA_END=1365 /DNA_ORIENTATION=+
MPYKDDPISTVPYKDDPTDDMRSRSNNAFIADDDDGDGIMKDNNAVLAQTSKRTKKPSRFMTFVVVLLLGATCFFAYAAYNNSCPDGESAITDKASSSSSASDEDTKAEQAIIPAVTDSPVSDNAEPEVSEPENVEPDDSEPEDSSAPENAAPDNADAPVESKQCKDVPKHEGKADGLPVWVGHSERNGAQMLRDLVSSTTGWVAGKIATGNFCDEDGLIICTTLWPNKVRGRAIGIDKVIPPANNRTFDTNAWMMIRNPLTEIPAVVNYWYQISNQNGRGDDKYTMQAPIEYWEEYRDKQFNDLISRWVGPLQQWKDLDKYDVSFYIPYEHFVDEVKGPLLFQEAIDRLQNAGHTFSPKSAADMKCLWRRNVDKSARSNPTHNLEYAQTFTKEQYETILEKLHAVFKTLRDKRAKESIKSYIKAVEALV